MDLHNEDAFEGLEGFNFTTTGCRDLSPIVVLCLLKLRVALTLQIVQAATTPAARRAQILSDAVGINRALRKDVGSGNDLTPHIKKAKDMAAESYAIVHDVNPYYWRGLLEPEDNTDAARESVEAGTIGEAQCSIWQTLDAWLETPGALEWVREQFEKENASRSG